MSKIIAVEPLRNYFLDVVLDDGRRAVVDIRRLLGHPAFEPLRDASVFERVRVDEIGGLEWPGGPDICVDWVEAEIAASERDVVASS
jgi:hypothetical protein